MNNFDKKISDKVKSYLDENVEFSTEESEKIHLKIQSGIHKSRKFNPLYLTALASAATILLILSFSFLKGQIVGPENDHAVQGPGEKETTINYEVTPTFVSEDEVFVGLEGKVGFLNNNFIENEFQKTVWHFWGESDEIKGVFRVEGTHLETGEKFPILLDGPGFEYATWEFNHGFFTQPNLGATKTMPSNVGFEKSGLWKVSVYLDKKLWGEFILEVKK